MEAPNAVTTQWRRITASATLATLATLAAMVALATRLAAAKSWSVIATVDSRDSAVVTTYRRRYIFTFCPTCTSCTSRPQGSPKPVRTGRRENAGV
jgi:hypothetical protein